MLRALVCIPLRALTDTVIRAQPWLCQRLLPSLNGTMGLTDIDYQFLAALAHHGRRAVRECLAGLGGASADENDLIEGAPPVQPSLLDPASRADLVRALRADQLPWQQLRQQILASGALILFPPQLPVPLRHIPDPPLALYALGDIGLLDGPAVAMVGARQATRRSLVWAEQTAGRLSDLGLVVVSGMAFGIDAAAHRGALANGRTIAVLGSGLLRPSPRTHEPLMRGILEAGGLVVSEYSLSQEARKFSFPERNRLVTGLSQGVVIVEAGPRSGSLISARLALEQGREVMAVPGPVGLPGAVGCHRLLKQGAALVENADDILSALNLEQRGSQPLPDEPCAAATAHPQPELAEQVLALLDALPTPVDELVNRTGAPPALLAAVLTRLELRGFVQRQGEGYIRSP